MVFVDTKFKLKLKRHSKLALYNYLLKKNTYRYLEMVKPGTSFLSVTACIYIYILIKRSIAKINYGIKKQHNNKYL